MTDLPQIKRATLETMVQRALVEDLDDAGDVTSVSLLDHGLRARPRSSPKLSGCWPARTSRRRCSTKLDPTLEIEVGGRGGDVCWSPEWWSARSPAGPIDTRRRAGGALNFLQHLSGVATLTAAFADACAPHGVSCCAPERRFPGCGPPSGTRWRWAAAACTGPACTTRS